MSSRMRMSSGRCCGSCTTSAWWLPTACAAMRRAALQQITLLDPNWLTGAIYTLLNSPTVRDQAGEFGRAQLGTLLDPKLYPEQWHEFILDMMQDPDIGLCFELPGTDHERYLIPEALPANEPDYGIWPDGRAPLPVFL